MPSRLTTIAQGSEPTGIAGPAVIVAVSIGVTVSEPLLATYAVRPSGVSAIASGPEPTRIAFPALCVLSGTGVTVPDW